MLTAKLRKEFGAWLRGTKRKSPTEAQKLCTCVDELLVGQDGPLKELDTQAAGRAFVGEYGATIGVTLDTDERTAWRLFGGFVGAGPAGPAAAAASGGTQARSSSDDSGEDSDGWESDSSAASSDEEEEKEEEAAPALRRASGAAGSGGGGRATRATRTTRRGGGGSSNSSSSDGPVDVRPKMTAELREDFVKWLQEKRKETRGAAIACAARVDKVFIRMKAGGAGALDVASAQKWAKEWCGYGVPLADCLKEMRAKDGEDYHDDYGEFSTFLAAKKNKNR